MIFSYDFVVYAYFPHDATSSTEIDYVTYTVFHKIGTLMYFLNKLVGLFQ